MYNQKMFKELSQVFKSIISTVNEEDTTISNVDAVLALMYTIDEPDYNNDDSIVIEMYESLNDIKILVKNLSSNVDSAMLEDKEIKEVLTELEARCIRYYIIYMSKRNNEYDQMCDVIESLCSDQDLSWLNAYDLLRLVFSQQERNKYLDDTDSLAEDIMFGRLIDYSDVDQVCNEMNNYDADVLGQLLSSVTEDDIYYIKN